ncbi:AzlD domain-containing protein [Pseudonocardia adelaidensis]|uniref:Branched-subunit amino acid transport protein n=1 Tax=Pseudonocardia adelaidensis TaxID=648754 RepID=A0ABP9NX53_9PSEU
MRELAVLVVIGLGTYAMRAAFLVTARPEPPASLARTLPYVGPAVLAAITLPALLAPRGAVTIGDTVPALLAAAVTALLWWRTRSLPLALFAGLGVSALAEIVLR